MIVAGGRKEIAGSIISFIRFSIDCSTERSPSPPSGDFAVPPETVFRSAEFTAYTGRHAAPTSAIMPLRVASRSLSMIRSRLRWMRSRSAIASSL